MTIKSKSFATAISCVALAAPGFAINIDKPVATTQAVTPPAASTFEDIIMPELEHNVAPTARPSRLVDLPAPLAESTPELEPTAQSGLIASTVPAPTAVPPVAILEAAAPPLALASAPVEPMPTPTLQDHVRAIIPVSPADMPVDAMTVPILPETPQPTAEAIQPAMLTAPAIEEASLSPAYLPASITADMPEIASVTAAPEAPVAVATATEIAVPAVTAPAETIEPVVPMMVIEPAPAAAVAEVTSPTSVAVPAISEAPAPVITVMPEAPAAPVALTPPAAPAPAPAIAQDYTASAAPTSAGAIDLRQAIAIGIDSNPEINQAIMNKEAIEFERKQAQGLYAPRVNIEASAGVRRLENNTRRTLNIADQELYPIEGQVNAEWTVLDFGRRRGELTRQASRVDGAALRVLERSEFIGLQIARQYLDILLQQRIVAASQDNVTFHRNLVNDLGQGVTQGSISIADQQQAQERMQAAVVRQVEAEEALENAKITLRTLTGLDINDVNLPPSLRNAMPPTINETVGLARTHNPRVKEAGADVDAATALVNKHRGDLYPTVGLDGRARAGDDIDGFRGSTNDLQARVVMRWNIFDGGINRAKLQEMVRRASEARFRLHEVSRAAEEDARRAWNSWSTQGKLTNELATEAQVSDDLLLSYRSQFNVGRRSLLDVLDAQNTRYNVQVRLETARFSQQFAEYQVLAATNQFLTAIGAVAPPAATSDERGQFNYGPPDPAELQRRVKPN